MATIHGIEATTAELKALAMTGYGHFTSMHVEDGAVRGFDLHLERLVGNAKAVFGVDLDEDAVIADIREAVTGSSGSCTLRVTMFDPAINLGNIGAVTPRPVPLITSRPSGGGTLPPLRVKTIAFQRDTPEVKHVGLFSSLHHRVAAKKSGFDDVLFVDPVTTNVSEGSTWNIGFIDADGTVIWPDAAVLPGVTMSLLRRADGGHARHTVALDQVGRMRAAFATNASIGVRPISVIDGHGFDSNDSKIVELQRAYAAIPGRRVGHGGS
ncbi:branched-subunit amino acid aminotransferase/4-amino-4-deoxychorismate lyase [Nocardioides albertanoniae]|uniref:Branched-subunit amino acid aminotransferase/4-amino-4-deoxychorismate lyase n=1 Tax=Nocardioides albertanoniae TaxID=1175486 RepID=A0A543A8R1_9ACTN|nr:aminotransferase class IV [Nocardioides albertanoniae]TQL68965.1 branched-subunit amino acid aminotransferase/4-amino-4-deoxychorismate lyase [Nocardioides albertanoniae]